MHANVYGFCLNFSLIATDLNGLLDRLYITIISFITQRCFLHCAAEAQQES